MSRTANMAWRRFRKLVAWAIALGLFILVAIGLWFLATHKVI